MARHNYRKSLNNLIEIANNEGYEVVFDKMGNSEVIYHQIGKKHIPLKIRIYDEYTLEIKVYVLLHELGHHNIRKDWVKFKRLLPITAKAEQIYNDKKEVKYKRRLTYNVSCMEEEFKAWDKGYELGNKLGILINEDRWYRLRNKCLMEYMRYYSSKKV